MLQLPLTSLGDAWADSQCVRFRCSSYLRGHLGMQISCTLSRRGWRSQHAAKSERVAYLGTRQPGNDLAQFGVGIAAKLGMQGVVHLKCHLSLKQQSTQNEPCGWRRGVCIFATAGDAWCMTIKGSSLSQGPAPCHPSVQLAGASIEDTLCSHKERQRP